MMRSEGIIGKYTECRIAEARRQFLKMDLEDNNVRLYLLICFNIIDRDKGL